MKELNSGLVGVDVFVAENAIVTETQIISNRAIMMEHLDNDDSGTGVVEVVIMALSNILTSCSSEAIRMILTFSVLASIREE